MPTPRMHSKRAGASPLGLQPDKKSVRRLSDGKTEQMQGVRYITEEMIIRVSGEVDIPNLTALNLTLSKEGGKKIKYIENLEKCKKLQSLNLSHNILSRIEKLSHLTRLKELNLSFNSITKIEGLESLTNLQTLNLVSNQITVIPAWLPKRLRNLRTLRLAKNRIESLLEIRKLRVLANLTNVSIAENEAAALAQSFEYTVFNLRSLHTLDGQAVTPAHRTEADQRFSQEEVERLEQLLFEAETKIGSLEEDQQESKVSQRRSGEFTSRLETAGGEKDAKIQALTGELEAKSELVSRKTAELSQACQKHYDLEQQLAFFKIDSKFSKLRHRPATPEGGWVAAEDNTFGESPYIGKGKYKYAQVAEQSQSSTSQQHDGPYERGGGSADSSLRQPGATGGTGEEERKMLERGLDEQLTGKKKAINRAEEKFKALQGALGGIEKQIAAATEQLAVTQSLQKQVPMGDPERRGLHQRLLQQLRLVEKLKDKAKELNGRLKDADEAVDRAAEDLDILEEEVSATGDNDDRDQDRTDLEEKCAQKEQELEEKNQEYEDLKEELDATLQELRQARDNIEDLQSKLSGESGGASPLAEELTQLAGSLRGYLDSSSAAVGGEADSDRLAAVSLDRDQLLAKVSRLENDLTLLDAEASETVGMQKKIQGLQKALAEERAASQVLLDKGRRENGGAAPDRLNSLYREAGEEIEKLEAEIRDKDTAVKALEQRLADAEPADGLDQELTRLKNERDALLESLEAKDEVQRKHMADSIQPADLQRRLDKVVNDVLQGLEPQSGSKSDVEEILNSTQEKLLDELKEREKGAQRLLRENQKIAQERDAKDRENEELHQQMIALRKALHEAAHKSDTESDSVGTTVIENLQTEIEDLRRKVDGASISSPSRTQGGSAVGSPRRSERRGGGGGGAGRGSGSPAALRADGSPRRNSFFPSDRTGIPTDSFPVSRGRPTGAPPGGRGLGDPERERLVEALRKAEEEMRDVEEALNERSQLLKEERKRTGDSQATIEMQDAEIQDLQSVLADHQREIDQLKRLLDDARSPSPRFVQGPSFRPGSGPNPNEPVGLHPYDTDEIPISMRGGPPSVHHPAAPGGQLMSTPTHGYGIHQPLLPPMPTNHTILGPSGTNSGSDLHRAPGQPLQPISSAGYQAAGPIPSNYLVSNGAVAGPVTAGQPVVMVTSNYGEPMRGILKSSPPLLSSASVKVAEGLLCNVAEHHFLEDLVKKLRKKIQKLREHGTGKGGYKDSRNMRNLAAELENRHDELESLDLAIVRQKVNLNTIHEAGKGLVEGNRMLTKELKRQRKDHQWRESAEIELEMGRERLEYVIREVECVEKTLRERRSELKEADERLAKCRRDLGEAHKEAAKTVRGYEAVRGSLLCDTEDAAILREKKEELEEEAVALLAQVKELREVKVGLERQVGEMGEILLSRDKQSRELGALAEDSTKRVQRFQSEVAELQEKKKALEGDYRHMKESSTLKDLESLLGHEEELRCSIQEKESHLSSLLQKTEHYKRELDTGAKEVADVQAAHDQMEGDLERMRAEIEESKKKRGESVEKLNEAKQQLLQYVGEVDQMREVLSELKSRLSSLEESVRRGEDQLEKVREQKETLERQREEARQEKRATEERLDSLQRECDNHRREETRLREDRTEAASQLSEIKEQCRSLQKEAEEAMFETSAREAEHESLSRKIEDRKAELGNLSALLKDAEMAFYKLETACEHSMSERESVQKEVEEQREKSEEARTASIEAAAKLTEKEKEVDRVEEELRRLEEDCRRQEVQLGTLREDCQSQELSQRKKSAESEVRLLELKNECAQVRLELSTVQEEQGSIAAGRHTNHRSEELAQALKAAEREKQSLENKLGNLQNEVWTIQKQWEEDEESLKEYRQQVANYRKELRKVKSETASEMGELMEVSSGHEQRAKALDEELRSLKTVNMDLASQLSTMGQLKDQSHTFEHKMESLKSDIQEEVSQGLQALESSRYDSSLEADLLHQERSHLSRRLDHLRDRFTTTTSHSPLLSSSLHTVHGSTAMDHSALGRPSSRTGLDTHIPTVGTSIPTSVEPRCVGLGSSHLYRSISPLKETVGASNAGSPDLLPLPVDQLNRAATKRAMREKIAQEQFNLKMQLLNRMDTHMTSLHSARIQSDHMISSLKDRVGTLEHVYRGGGSFHSTV